MPERSSIGRLSGDSGASGLSPGQTAGGGGKARQEQAEARVEKQQRKAARAEQQAQAQEKREMQEARQNEALEARQGQKEVQASRIQQAQESKQGQVVDALA